MHRAKLQKAMLKKLNGEVPIHLGKKVASVTAVREKGVGVTFEDGMLISADVVIGADGIKSVCISLLIISFISLLILL
jgi:2-polyprenyl-6-methoxyphenol hydroxylase-like FAD-dependent oxidoreductase